MERKVEEIELLFEVVAERDIVSIFEDLLDRRHHLLFVGDIRWLDIDGHDIVNELMKHNNIIIMMNLSLLLKSSLFIHTLP